MVAAWIRAETGVGPSMASGSQTWSGNCADLAAAPRYRRKAMSSTWKAVSEVTWLKTPV